MEKKQRLDKRDPGLLDPHMEGSGVKPIPVLRPQGQVDQAEKIRLHQIRSLPSSKSGPSPVRVRSESESGWHRADRDPWLLGPGLRLRREGGFSCEVSHQQVWIPRMRHFKVFHTQSFCCYR